MSRFTRGTDKNTRKLTDFFAPRTSSVSSLSQPPSSQPSSQPGPSQRMAPTTSQSQRKGNQRPKAPPKTKQEVISLSSDSGPIVISSDTSHISISSDSVSKAPIIISDSNSAKNAKIPKKPLQSMQPKATKSVTRSNVPTTSDAKLIVRRRAEQPARDGAPPLVVLPKATRPKKRKCSWDASESSEEDEIFIPKPSQMKPSLTVAPVLRMPQGPPSAAAASTAPPPSSPLSSPPPTSVRSRVSRSSKRARLDTTNVSSNASELGNEADIEELVPSSQSDEQELTIPKDTRKDPASVKKTVDKWRRESSVIMSPPRAALVDRPTTPPASSPPAIDWPLQQSSPVSAPLADADGDVPMKESVPYDAAGDANGPSNIDSESEVDQQLLDEKSSATLSTGDPSSVPMTPPRELSPNAFPSPFSIAVAPHTPSSHLSPQKPYVTPKQLTADEKTAMVIAKIKADAQAAVAAARDSPKPEEISLQDLDSDSDDDLMHGLRGKGDVSPRLKSSLLITKPRAPVAKTPSTSKSSPQSSSPEEAVEVSKRYNLRRRSSPRTTSPESEPTSSRLPPIPKKSHNPLAKLLKAKQAADKKGRGMEALYAAEATLSRPDAREKGKGKMREEMDDDSRWNDEAAAMRAVYQGTEDLHLAGADSDESDSDSASDPEDFAVDAATRLLGDDEDKVNAVNKILLKDRKGHFGKKKKVTRGVPLWNEQQPAAAVDATHAPELPFDDADITSTPSLKFLQTVVRSGNQQRLSRCLIPQLWASLERPQLLALVPWLYSIGMSTDSPLAQRATDLLVYTARQCAGAALNVSSMIVSCLRGLGAKESSLAPFVTQSSIFKCAAASVEHRVACLSRLVSVVKAFIENDAVAVEDISSAISSLLLIGLDPTSPSVLKMEIMTSIDMLGSCIPSTSDSVSSLELVICNELLNLLKEQSVMNRAYLLSFLWGGSPQILRISRWLAHSLMFNVDIPPKESFLGLPELDSLVGILEADSRSIFDVSKNANLPNYFVDLGSHVDILETILNDIDAYTYREKATAVKPLQESTESPSRPSSPLSQLQVIANLLTTVHGKISDNQGQVERSRVKLRIDSLVFRIRYQREACIRSRSRATNITQFLAKPRAKPVPRRVG